jgi:hypothetical protein
VFSSLENPVSHWHSLQDCTSLYPNDNLLLPYEPNEDHAGGQAVTESHRVRGGALEKIKHYKSGVDWSSVEESDGNRIVENENSG